MTDQDDMTSSELFARCAALRRDLADLVESLTDEQLATPSACGEWDVRTVIAHLTVLPTVSRLEFGVTVLRSRGNMDRTIDTLSRRAGRRSPNDIALTLREYATSRATPPTMGAIAPFADLVIHTSDARLPLGLPWTPPARDAATTLGFLASAPIGFPTRGKLDGIRIVATDLDRSWRDGAELTGKATDLILALCHRPGALERVSGPGKDLLASRL